jgi:hypothetical protein
VPATVLPGTELIHLGGGESLPCPDAGRLPLDDAARRLGLGTASLALPPARVHLLRDAVVCPSSGVVRAPDGRIVAESVTADMVGTVTLDRSEFRTQPEDIEGTVAVFRSPYRSRYHTLLDHLPRAALLIHPAMHRVGPLTLVHDGGLTPLEQWLLPHLSGRNIRLRQVEPGTPIRAERVVIPGYVTRPGAGAVPSWYRRWADKVGQEAAAATPATDGPRRLYLDQHTSPSTITNRSELDAVLAAHDVEAIDPEAVPVAELLAMVQDAELIIGAHGSGLSHALFSRQARLVELLRGHTVLPHIYYLASSKGLPYDFVPAVSASDSHGTSGPLTVDTGWLDTLLTRTD